MAGKKKQGGNESVAVRKIYKVAPGIAIASNGVILAGGQEVTEKDFSDADVFNSLLKSKKVVEAGIVEGVEETLEDKAASSEVPDKDAASGEEEAETLEAVSSEG